MNTDEPNKQTEANKRWVANNKEHANYLRYRSMARSFIRKMATAEDLAELEQMIADKKTEL
ncbi:hypothetical protein [Weissella ceti]|uniref:Phage tail protein n=1 Tax=Weissella ceti TaxID=759620 RepID=A0A088GLE4_9LACO|nr:hypothetical protein [Weissella ceti]AIM63077.1 Phage tail protein [Weissella ceti]